MIADMVKGLEPPPAAIAWNEIRRHTRNVASDTEPTKFVFICRRSPRIIFTTIVTHSQCSFAGK